MRHLSGCAVCVAVCAALVGCGGGTGDVSGTVTFDGKPVANGSITFVKDGGAVREGAVIRDGAFQTKLPPGRYTLELSAQKVTGSRKQKGFDGKDEVVETTDQLFPAWYNTKSELTEEIKSGSNTLKLDLKSTK